jgi:hypothetical protein
VPLLTTRALALAFTFVFPAGFRKRTAAKVTNPGKNYTRKPLPRQPLIFDKLLVFNELLCLAVQMHEIKSNVHTIVDRNEKGEHRAHFVSELN